MCAAILKETNSNDVSHLGINKGAVQQLGLAVECIGVKFEMNSTSVPFGEECIYLRAYLNMKCYKVCGIIQWLQFLTDCTS